MTISFFFLLINLTIESVILLWKDPNKNIDKSIPSDKSKLQLIPFLLISKIFFNKKKDKKKYIILAIKIFVLVFTVIISLF